MRKVRIGILIIFCCFMLLGCDKDLGPAYGPDEQATVRVMQLTWDRYGDVSSITIKRFGTNELEVIRVCFDAPRAPVWIGQTARLTWKKRTHRNGYSCARISQVLLVDENGAPLK